MYTDAALRLLLARAKDLSKALLKAEREGLVLPIELLLHLTKYLEAETSYELAEEKEINDMNIQLNVEYFPKKH